MPDVVIHCGVPQLAVLRVEYPTQRMRTERALPASVIEDDDLLRVLLESILVALDDQDRPADELRRLFKDQGDPNDRRQAQAGFEGLCYLPLATSEKEALRWESITGYNEALSASST